MATRDRLIDTTIDLMRRHGVAGTGLNELLKRSGVARRSIYLNFPGGKAELVAKATSAAGSVMSDTIGQLARSGGPRAALHGFFALWRAALVDSGYTAGCPIVAAALGRTQTPAAADAAGTVFTEWTAQIADMLVGDGMPRERAEMLGSVAVAALEGAVVMGIATQSAEPLRHAERALTDLLDLHTAALPAGEEELPRLDSNQ